MQFQIILYLILGFLSLLFNGRSYRSPYSRSYRYEDDPMNVDVTTPIVEWFRRRNRRIEALKHAKMYLKPYEKIFGNLCLSNKFCSINLIKKEKTIICTSKVFNANGRKMILAAKSFSPMDIDEYFNTMCGIFGWYIKYEDVYNSLKAVAIISESVMQTKAGTQDVPPKEEKQPEPAQETIELKHLKREMLDTPDKLTDVNNCSEAELTALPGINIIISKKIIRFRDEERPFKNVDDFINVMNIKPHFIKQLRGLITVNPLNQRKFKKAKAERIIDL